MPLSNRQIKCTIDEFEKQHTVNDLPKEWVVACVYTRLHEPSIRKHVGSMPATSSRCPAHIPDVTRTTYCTMRSVAYSHYNVNVQESLKPVDPPK